MVLLITAHNTFSGRAQSSSGTMDEQGGSRHVHVRVPRAYVRGVLCPDNFHANGSIHLIFLRVRLCVCDPCTFAMCACVRACVRDLWRGGAGVQAGKCRQLLESLQGVYGATAQVPRTSGWIS